MRSSGPDGGAGRHRRPRGYPQPSRV